MASPMPTAPNGGWNPNGQVMPSNNSNMDESGIQIKTMGLKVHYTFDKENKVNCLARSSQTLQVQTIPLDEQNSIGVVDLRACLQAVTECSPELGSLENDYTVYALDYSEPDTPLVGQGLLSWALESMRNDHIAQLPKMVTGRVTRNVLAVFAGGNRETLEVKLRLTPASKVQRPELSMDMQMMRPMDAAMTPTGISEWNSLIQSNPHIGHTAPVSRVASPALSQGAPAQTQRRDSFGPSAAVPIMPSQEIMRVAPVPVEPTALPPQPSSRPSSRSSRRKQPTGRPRGRPRKKPVEGNTSGYEDGTEGEEGPAKKRAKTTKVEKAAPNPFGTEPDSLRVAASISGSLRNFRPIAMNTEGVPGNHLQEVPRAPTPVPEGRSTGNLSRSGPNGKPRRESSMRQEFNPNQYSQQSGQAPSPSQDGRSPDSLAPTPNYSEDSPQDIGSSPPVARTTPFMRSSPPPSSPILPPMPQRSGASFMSTEMNTDLDDLFDENLLQPFKEPKPVPNIPGQKVVEVTDATGIPTQVFQIQDGPGGQGLVHIQNYNTPLPTSTPAGPPATDAPSLPPLKKNIGRPRSRNPAPKRSQPSPPTLALTPPPTTDAIEKPASPSCIPESSVEATTESGESADGPRESPSAEPAPAPEMSSVQDSAVQLPPDPTKQIPRHLSRSQSAGPLALPTVPASEPAGPSSLSQYSVAEAPRAKTEIPTALRRSNSFGPLSLPVPASDPLGPSLQAPNTMADIITKIPNPPSDLPPAPSSPPMRSNKNMVKKQSIKERLEKAIANGEMPPFCTNCGAIETPTWRKIWVQDHEGVPEYVEYSEKPGRITAIDVLKRDSDQKPLAYRVIKKSLGNDDDKSLWLEQLLCNPCGIWVTKYRAHRPQDKWDNCFGRLGQERRKRGPGQNNNSRSKRARTKSDSQPNPTSEAYPATDPIGPIEPSSPKQAETAPPHSTLGPGFEVTRINEASSSFTRKEISNELLPSNPGSTHSRGSGTAGSPINIELDEQLGTTRRLLFPSPRKDNMAKALTDVNVNIVQTLECRQNKELAADKENISMMETDKSSKEQDDIDALFQSPARPSTPPPKAKAATATTPFKTPTRPTPNHRPITRSVSRSLRSVRDVLMSPNQQALLQRTPIQTPRGTIVRRSPRNQVNFENVFDTPLSRTISQMLSDPAFDLSNDLDLSSLPALETNHGTLIDFGNLLSTDGIIPSSPPKDGALGFDYNGSSEVWSQWAIETKVRVEEAEE